MRTRRTTLAARLRLFLVFGSRAQAMVEFALVLGVSLVFLLVGIQFAIIGNCALALSQAAYQGARWASVNPDKSQSDLQAYLSTVASPTINDSNLTVALSPGPTRSFGSSLQVTLTYNTTGKIFLANPFGVSLGSSGGKSVVLGVTFPSTLSAAESAMSE